MEESQASMIGQGAKPRTRRDGPVSADTATGPARPRRLARRKKFAFAAILLGLAWASCELAAWPLFRLATGQPFSWTALQDERRERANRPPGIGGAISSQVHPYVGYVRDPRPDSGIVRESDGRTMPVSNFGYVDDKDPIHKRGPGKLIVGIFGGSVASYFGVNGVHRLEEALRRSPEYADKQFVFVNAALGGYKQPQQLTTLAYLTALGAEFDVVLNIDGFNEVALHELENSGHHVFPAFPRSWHARVGGNDPASGSARAELNGLEERRNAWARWASSPPFQWSILANLVWKLQDRRLEWASYSIVKGHQELQNRGGPYVATGPAREFAGRDELFEHLASIWSNSSRAIDALCRQTGTRYYHFLQPNQYVADSKPMDPAERSLAFNAEHPYRKGVQAGYPLLLREGRGLRERGVAFHDLTAIFRDHPESLYIDDCCHYNQAGLEILAEAVARAILDDPAAAPKP
ncbi:SGNH/GDSL hydrolase family protein [Paludisphaera soli]|uniref:SGNH/GDSL hydrolase family protein n=1 Tax=Paludisphaera soli TaxID=2712865 RepID=UPI0013ED0069|nr:SGNH/GDSL hydrolase family protein [Paludisphaera soli]